MTGLDPAGPHFQGYASGTHLTSTDADFVDVFHTNVWGLGNGDVMGDVDFFPNGGIEMPGCSKLIRILFHILYLLTEMNIIFLNPFYNPSLYPA